MHNTLVEGRIRERQRAGIGQFPVQAVAVQRFDRAADVELARVDVHAGELHARQLPVDEIEGAAEAAADVEDALAGAQVGHAEQDLREPRLRPLEFIRLRFRIEGDGDVPVAQVHEASGLAAPEAFYQVVEIRRHRQAHRHPQQYVASRLRDNAMKLHAVQRLRGPCTGVRRWR